MITTEQKKTAQWAMDYALKNGCQSARLGLYNNSNTSFEIRDMKIDRLSQASENGLSIQIFVDGKFGSYSTNRLDKSELESFIKNAIDSTRYLAEDKARTLPDPALYFKGDKPDLELYDNTFEKINPDDKVALAMKVCDEIMGKNERVISSNSSYSDGDNFGYYLTSNGFEGHSSSSYYSLFGSASIKGDGDARPESYWYESSLFYDGLKKDGIGTRALERALGKLGQTKINSGKMQMVVDFMNSRQLLSPVIGAMYGAAIQQKNSFLLDKLDQKVFNANVTIVDEPHLIKSSGARYFDNEGVATKHQNIFDAGILKTYFIDTYHGKKLDVPQTISSPSILTLPPSDKDLNALVAAVDKGILVTGFNGGNCNGTTGDFSYGIEGFLIEKGKLAQPINEMNVTGNMITLWNNLAAFGNDARKDSSWRIPSLLFDNVDFSGI
ncbi:MAG: TldD/PmbA family protein [Tannerella sp.]|jgi:PmbA protein|nr:TldD/PmbA family protein [Tannerella sp.]